MYLHVQLAWVKLHPASARFYNGASELLRNSIRQEPLRTLPELTLFAHSSRQADKYNQDLGFLMRSPVSHHPDMVSLARTPFMHNDTIQALAQFFRSNAAGHKRKWASAPR